MEEGRFFERQDLVDASAEIRFFITECAKAMNKYELVVAHTVLSWYERWLAENFFVVPMYSFFAFGLGIPKKTRTF